MRAIEEAISHAREISKRDTVCEECRQEHAQLADWLEELKMLRTAITPPNEWVSVEEGMPKEHDSIFKKLMGPDKWGPGMFERLSDDVIVAVKFADGTRRSGFARTKDGIWAGLPSIGCPVVTHWMPMPEPPDHRLPEKGRKTDGQ